MKKILHLTSLVVIATSFSSCKKGGESSPTVSAVEQTIVDKHNAHTNEFISLLNEFESTCSKITDEESFDKHHAELTSLNKKLNTHAAKLTSLTAPPKEAKKNIMSHLESGMKKFTTQASAIKGLKKISSRKDEIAVISEEYDSALFSYFMFSYQLYVFDAGSNKYGGKLSKPAEAIIDVSDETLLQFKGDLKATLFRYLAGNPRWEIREERGKTYAVRLESANGYQPTLNGFLSYNHKQTRVLISFDKKYGFGRQRNNVTETKAGVKKLSVIIEAPHSGTPGHSSYTIIRGGEIFLEIYDQADELERTFTKKTFAEISTELRDIIKYQKKIDTQGVMPASAKSHYPVALPTESSFEITDDFQPGIFKAKASINPTQAGKCYIKVFNVKTDERLSEARLTPRSTRHVGWSTDGKTHFPYTSQFTVYEGNWTTKYEARFELWHKGNDGTEKKLAETQRMIHGWQR